MVILPFYLECNVLWQLIHSVQLTHIVEPKKISTRKTQKFQRLPGFLRPIFEVGKKDIKKGFGKISGLVPLPKAF